MLKYTSLFLLFCILVITPDPSDANTGSRPRNLAVSSDGETVLVTSLGGTSVMERIGSQSPTPIPVGAPSWGVCMVNDLTAVVTHPYDAKITVLSRPNTTSSFGTTINSYPIPYLYCTEVIPSWNPGYVLVANRGAKADATGAEDWQHAIYKISISDGSIASTRFVTEREPSALTLSPSGNYLFVGHTQGALGGDGIATDDDEANWAFDGGSIVMFRVSDQAPIKRFAIGSPVRGLEVWPPADYDGTETYLGGGYRLYFTHVGDGAQSEAPDFGGRAIANVISSIQFSSADAVVTDSRQDVVFGHDPELDPSPTVTHPDSLPAALPEQMAFRWDTTPDPDEWELWVTNSASGTVSRADVVPSTGELDVAATQIDITAAPGESFFVVSRNPNDPNDPPAIVEATATSANALILVDEAVNAWHGVVSKSRANRLTSYGSNPRGIVFDAANDRLLLVTQFDHQLVAVDPSGPTVSGIDLYGTPVSGEERMFFAAGFAFDFRESGGDKVNNISCGTCHPGGHLDGKVRMTVRAGANRNGNPARKPVAVPSVFDVGMTEWIFFEGLITIRDADIAGTCNYCNVGIGGFFTDTRNFTNSLSSPFSPTAVPASPFVDASLNADQQWGRAYFERLNCYRCHGGATGTGATFLRTEEPDLPGFISDQGPLPGGLVTENRFFHDPGQPFITFIPLAKAAPIDDGQSLRNMTDVGTRPAGDALRMGINTPALAGAWDNAPYLHDGRYRTLKDVLDHTWVNPAWSHQAAPDPDPGMVLPDNAFNVLTFAEDPLPNVFTLGQLETFQTHRHGDMGPARSSVTDWLANPNHVVDTAGAADDIVAFLSALSSRTDPCEDTDGLVLGISSLDRTIEEDDVTTFTWSTNFPVSCTVEWGEVGGGTTTVRTPVAISHSLDLATSADRTYTIAIDAEMPVCGLEAVQVTDQWCVPVTVTDFIHIKFWPCVYTDLSWNTTASVACRIEWGLYGQGFPNEDFTAVGTEHELSIPTQSRRKYQARITPLFSQCGEQATFSWKEMFCLVQGKDGPNDIPAVTGIQSVAPNPFNPSTEITFTLQQSSLARIAIYDLRGRLVRELHDGSLPAGIHRRVWDGKSNNGSAVASGVYFVEFRAGDVNQVRKLTLIE